MLTVWGRKNSSNVQAVMWGIGELGLAYTRHDVGHSFGGTDTPDFIAMNPNGTVPVVQDGTNPPLWESGAILRYLCRRYGEGILWPADIVEQAEVDRWAEWAKITVSLAFTGPIFWRVVRTAPKDRDPAAIKKAVAAFERKLSIAEARLSQQAYLASEQLSLADIQFGHTLYRYFDIDIARADLPVVKAYYDRLTENPHYREHVMVSYDTLRVT